MEPFPAAPRVKPVRSAGPFAGYCWTLLRLARASVCTTSECCSRQPADISVITVVVVAQDQ